MCRGLLPGPKHLSLHSIVREGQNGPASVICVHGDDAVNGEVSRLIVAAGSDDYGKGRSGKKCGCDFLSHSALFCLNGAITSGKKQLVVTFCKEIVEDYIAIKASGLFIQCL